MCRRKSDPAATGQAGETAFASSRTSRWASTACTTGGTLPRSGPGSSRPGHDERGADAQGRHTAGQRVLDATGNLKAVQKLLGHASIQTTGDVYTDWDIDQLADTMRAVLEGGLGIVPHRRLARKPLQIERFSGGGGNRTRVRGRTDRASTSLGRD